MSTIGLIIAIIVGWFIFECIKDSIKASKQDPEIWGFDTSRNIFVAFTDKLFQSQMNGKPSPISIIRLDEIKCYQFSQEIPNQYEFDFEKKDLSEPLPEYPYLRLFLNNGNIVTLPLNKGGYHKDGTITVTFNDPKNAIAFSRDLNFFFYDFLPESLKEEHKLNHELDLSVRKDMALRDLAKGMAKLQSAPKQDASVVGRAVAGGIIAGPAGAVVGAISAADKNNKNRSK